jgi:hypothetical protein
MRQLQIAIVLIIICTNLFCQKYTIYRGDTINRYDTNNMKYGRWIQFRYSSSGFLSNTIDTLYPSFVGEGNLIIVNIPDEKILQIVKNKSDDIGDKDSEYGFLFLRDSTQLSFKSKYKNFYSVDDGYSFRYYYHFNERGYETDTIPKIIDIECFQKGILKSSQILESGSPIEYIVYYKGRSDTYKGCDPYVYKREFNGHKEKTEYFPDKKLLCSCKKITFRTTFGYCDTDTISLISNSKDTLTIDIKYKCKNIEIRTDKGKTVKGLLIIPKEKSNLIITFSPQGMCPFECQDTIIFQEHGKSKLGIMELSTLAVNLSYKNINKKEFILSKKELGDVGFFMDLRSFDGKFSNIVIKNVKGDILKEFNPEDYHSGLFLTRNYPKGEYFVKCKGINNNADADLKMILK